MPRAVTLSNIDPKLAGHPGYDPLLLTQEAADYLGVCSDQLLRMARLRQIASVRASDRKGSPVKFRLSELNRWVQAHEIKPLRAAN